MAINGSSIWLFVYDKDYNPAANGNQFPDKFIPVAEQTSLGQEESNNLIEAGHKSVTHQKYLYGKAEGSISLEALVPVSPAATEKGGVVLEKSFRQKKLVYIKRANSDGTNAEYAECLVENVSKDYPDDDVATLSVDLTCNGDFSATAPTINASDVVGSNG